MKIGDYRRHHMNGAKSGTLVRLDAQPSPGRWSVQYVQIMHDGSDVIGGGSSSSWPECEFSSVSDPKQLAAIKCYEARRKIHDLKYKVTALERDAETWRRVVQVMCESEKVLATDAT